jgi:hypothetical protein
MAFKLLVAGIVTTQSSAREKTRTETWVGGGGGTGRYQLYTLHDGWESPRSPPDVRQGL